jgi:hypothetical protein
MVIVITHKAGEITLHALLLERAGVARPGLKEWD